MSENNSFEEFKKKAVEENEKNFGAEIREKYGEEAAETSTNIIMGLTEEKWNRSEQLRKQYENLLLDAVTRHLDYHDPKVTEMCRIHGQWVSMFWEEGAYSFEAHKTLAQIYTTDERFISYYENIAKGACQYLSEAIIHYCNSSKE